MPGLKELRIRIGTIKSTQKITSAMKMVAAARLRKAQQLLTTSLPYSHNLLQSASRVLQELKYEESKKGITYIYPKLMQKPAKEETALLLLFSSDRGLCGGFNAYAYKVAAARIEELQAQGKKVKVIAIGRKARDLLKRKYRENIIDSIEGFARRGADYREASALCDHLLEMYRNKEMDFCEVVTSRFVSAITREVKSKRILPLDIETFPYLQENPVSPLLGSAFYGYEPDKMEMLETLLTLIFKMEIFQASAHSSASEEGARMTSMDSATRNARDMISKLTLKYNGIRQSAITKELIEIISGAEAL